MIKLTKRKERLMKFSRKAIALILSMLMVFGISGTAVFADEGTAGEKIPIADWDAYTDHALPKIYDEITDTQTAYVTLYFNEAVRIKNEAALITEMTSSITLAEKPLGGRMGKITSVAVSEDGKRLDFELSGWYAPFNGLLQSTGKWYNLVTAVGDKPVDSSMRLIIPNGLTTEVVSRTVADENSNASVTVRIVAPESATRGMVHLAVLKNGVTITPDDLGATVKGHWHDYRNTTAAEFVKNCTGDGDTSIGTVLGDEYTVTGSGDEITITAKNSEAGDILDLHVLSYLNDGTKNVPADTSSLSTAIAAAEKVDPAEWTAESYEVLADAVAAGKLIIDKLALYGANEIADAVNYINAAVDALVDVNAPGGSEVVDPGQGDGSQQGDTNNDQSKDNADKNAKDKNVATGDDFPVGMLLGLLIVSGAAAIVSVQRKKV